MPTSRPHHLTWLCNEVTKLKPKSILDIGVGFGSKGMLFREYTDVWYGDMFDFKTRIDGVEIFDKYITELQKQIYDNIYIGNILELIDELDNYDLIYMGDVLEHLERQEAETLIKKLKTKCKDLIIVTPIIVSEQEAVYGNENERHITQWSSVDFDDFRVVEIHNSLVLHYEKPEVYYCNGMKYYGERTEEVFKFKKYSGIQDNRLLFMGLYFAEDYEVYKNHTGRRYVFWNGSDVSRLLLKREWQEILKEYPATHICHNEQLKSELESVDIKSEIHPLFFADIKKYSVSEKNKERFQVYVNAHPGREDEYGIPDVVIAAKRMPEIDFFVYGVNGKNTNNLTYMGRIEEEEADKKMSKHHVFLRLNRHDGLSQQVIKAGLWGQKVVARLDIPHTTKVDDVVEIMEVLNHVHESSDSDNSLRDYLLGLNLNGLPWL